MLPASPSTAAVEAVRARILLALRIGLLNPGQRLAPIEDLASGLDVGQITARRALESLVADGVLVRQAGRRGGTFVADHPAQVDEPAVDAMRADVGHVHGLIDQRVLMEAAIVREAAARLTERDFAQLDRYVRLNDTTESWEVFHEADQAIHRIIADASGLPEVSAYYTVLGEIVGYFLPYPVEQLRGAQHDHHELVEALHRGQTDRAIEITIRHVRRLHQDMYVGRLPEDAAP